jgi:Cu(I)/Ag(I) efflux system membrane fusion protein
MDLIPVSRSEGGDEEGPRELTLSEAAVKLAEIEVAPVERRPVSAEVRMVGKVDYDETRLAYITAWVPGRIDRLYVDYTGAPVKKGDPLVYLYSPELLTAQEELYQALKGVKALERSGIRSAKETALRMVGAARDRLRLWGVTEKQIAEIEKRGNPSDHITIGAPISGIVIHKNGFEGIYVDTGTKIYTVADLSQVWVMLDAYESDLGWVRLGGEVEFETEAYPGETFRGKIVFIDPFLNAKTRTVKVRVEVPNLNGRLKPDMFVRAVARAEIAPDSSEDEASLVIPASAPLITGKRAVVYVAVPGKQGAFEGREIVLGPRTGDYYLVRDGLTEGEQVVVNGNFKIDSAIQILAKPSMMSPEGGVPASGHAHGEETPATVAQAAGKEAFEVPGAFRTQMDPVFSRYFKVHYALSRDKLGEAQSSAKEVREALKGVDMGFLEGATHMAWMGDVKKLEKSAGNVAGAKNIAKARAAFEGLSDSLYSVAKKFGVSGEATILRFHCPMAADGKGAYWLQNKEGTENPYFGSAMFKCGEQVETISSGQMNEQSGGHSHG